MFEYKRNPYKDGLGDILTDCVSVELYAPHIYCFGGDGGGSDDGGGDDYTIYEPPFTPQVPNPVPPNNDDDNDPSPPPPTPGDPGDSDPTPDPTPAPTPDPEPEPDPTPPSNVFGVNGVSKTGSMVQDAAIGWTSGVGSGQAGANFDMLAGATNSEVAQAQEMAAAGSSTAQIGGFLSGATTPAAGTIGTSSAGGNVSSAVEATALQTLGRKGSATPQLAKSYFDDVTNTISGGVSSSTTQTSSGAATSDDGFDASGFISTPAYGGAAAPNTLSDKYSIENRLDRRGDYLPDGGGVRYNPPGFPEGLATTDIRLNFYNEDAGGVMREMSPPTGTDVTGVNNNKGLGASESGAFAVLTVEQMNDLGRSLNKKYGDSSFLNLGDMTPGAQVVAFSEIAQRYPNQEYGRFDQRLGGQSIVRNMRLVGMNPDTGSVMLEGGNRGFFGSGIGSIFGMMAGGPVSQGMSLAGTANRAQNFALDNDTGSLVAMGLDAVGLPGSAVNQSLRLAGIDVNRYLPQSEGSIASSTTMYAPESEPDVPLSIPRVEPEPATAPTQRPDPGISVSVPTTAARGLVKRKRLPGQDVYGVTGSDFPFLSLSEELQTSGLAPNVKGRPGRFTQNRPR